VAIGPEPVLTYAATAPMPEGLDELLLGGFLARRRIELVRCVTVDLEVPATAHIVLEGYVEPGERRLEGPFGDHTGFYSQPDQFPVFHLTCVTSRKRPTYLTTIVGRPPMEDYYLGLASERIFLPMIRKTVPEIVDMHFPAEGIFHNLVVVSIDKRYPGHARKIMNAFWGLGQLMFSKTIVVVDKDVDVHDTSEVAWIVGTHMDPLRDVQMTRGPVDDLDDAADLPAYGGKMGIDATRKWASEGYMRRWPERIATTERAARRADDVWKAAAWRKPEPSV
jgi:4-hydroxy-3-polyprenylbenzoate decarboxylase